MTLAQLGGQDRQPAARRARRRAGQPGRGAAARALADRGGAVRDLVDRRRSRAGDGPRPTSRCAPPTGSTRPTPPSAGGRSRRCRWTRSASRCPTCRSASPTTRPRCGCTAIRSSRSATRARRWRAVGGRDPRRRTRLGAAQRPDRRRSGAVLGARWDTADELVDNLLAVFAAGRVTGAGGQSRPAQMDRRRQTEKTTRG